MVIKFLQILVVCYACYSCRKDIELGAGDITPYKIDYPNSFLAFVPKMPIPLDNPLTEQGVRLGRELFYETLLSGDNSQSCASCHAPSSGFSDNNKFSDGIDGIKGNRNAMPLFNLAWSNSFFWDGRSGSLEDQAFRPITDPNEMHNTWPNVVFALQQTDKYPVLFEEAFGTDIIDSVLVSKALAQFERTLISGNSPFDNRLNGKSGYTADELARLLNGYTLFITEADTSQNGTGNKGADCIHCHGLEEAPLFTYFEFRNNGLDEVHIDIGYEAVTGNPADRGKFKTPSLRNLTFTAPYMHDGRFETLEEVVEHYSSGLKKSPTIDPDMKTVNKGGLNLTPQQKADLVFFLKSLSDSSFITNPDFQDPN